MRQIKNSSMRISALTPLDQDQNGDSMRIPLIERDLPNYTRGEEIFHMVSHIAGGVFAFVALLLCVIKSSLGGDGWAIASSVVYGVTMIVLYCLSSVYHGLKPSLGKRYCRCWITARSIS